jgi:hypothetical protein
MSDELESWARPQYVRSKNKALLFYIAYGAIEFTEPLSAPKYRSNGPPKVVDVMAYHRAIQPDVLAQFCNGYIWEEFKRTNAKLAHQVEASPGCVILRGELADRPTLDYLRDSVGTISYLFDRGAVALYDAQILRWWTSAEWRAEVFNPGQFRPQSHAVIMVSEEPEGTWVHTRGMRKFARPDISIPRVGPKYRDAAIDLCDRFVEHMELGALPAEGEAIKVKALPPGGRVRHGGHLDDPDFNNTHIEIVWPGDELNADAKQRRSRQ